MTNEAFWHGGRASIYAKMNARSRPDVAADFRAKAVRAVVDHAAFKNLVPVEHGKSQRQAVRVSGNPASFPQWVNLSQPIRSIGENIRSDHGASPWFMKRKGSPFECSCPQLAFAKDMPCRLKAVLKGILDMISLD
ncbi:MAG: hypothetical protein MUC57_13305 [Desulfobacterales bacterium]|jgi:hypothetical protein|nr:hypothetical protein [Desulfobacterales bacterium]